MNIPSIVVALAATLGAPLLTQAQEDYRRELDQDFGSPFSPFFTGRGGLWVCEDFKFETSSLQGTRQIRGESLINVGAELGAVIYGDFTASVSVDAGLSEDVTMVVSGINGGYFFPFQAFGISDSPVHARISAGVLAGDVHVKDFSDFDTGTGYRAGLDFTGEIPGSPVSINAFLDFRVIQMDFDEEVNDGDTNFGGKGFVVGAGVTLKL